MKQVQIQPIKFNGFKCILAEERYCDNDRICLELIDSVSGESVATCTVNSPEVGLEDNEVIIKDYSENEGMYKCLLDSGVISEFKYSVSLGFVRGLVCEFLLFKN